MSSHAASLGTPAAPPSEPLPSASPIDAHVAPVQETRRRSGRAGTALVLGILGVVCAAIPLAGLVLGIFAITKGAGAAADLRRTGQSGRRKALAGEALGVIAVAASIAIPVVFGFLL